MIVEFGKLVLDIDVEKTMLYYEKAGELTEDCSCDGCCNYVSAAERLSPDTLVFFLQLGVAIRKPAELVTLCSEDDGRSVFYNGIYHICGRMLTDTDCWQPGTDYKGADCATIGEDNLYSVNEEFQAGFTNRISLKKSDFPEPVIQMETFLHHVPWVLGKSNPY